MASFFLPSRSKAQNVWWTPADKREKIIAFGWITQPEADTTTCNFPRSTQQQQRKYSKPTQFRMKWSQIRNPVMLFLLVNLGRVSVRDKITYFGRNCAEFLTTLLATHDSGALVATPSQLISHRAFPHWRCRKRIPRHLPTNRKNVLISHSASTWTRKFPIFFITTKHKKSSRISLIVLKGAINYTKLWEKQWYQLLFHHHILIRRDKVRRRKKRKKKR